MSLYDLNKDMLIELLIERDNWDKLSDSELKEKKNSIRNILMKRKAEKLDENVEHKEIIQKHYKYILSAKVSFYTYENGEDFIIIKSKKGIIYTYYDDSDIIFEPQYSDHINYDKLRIISCDLESYDKITLLLRFLEKLN